MSVIPFRGNMSFERCRVNSFILKWQATGRSAWSVDSIY